MQIKTTNMILEELEKIHKEFLDETIERKSLLFPKNLDFYFNKEWVAVEDIKKEIKKRIRTNANINDNESNMLLSELLDLLENKPDRGEENE